MFFYVSDTNHLEDGRSLADLKIR